TGLDDRGLPVVATEVVTPAMWLRAAWTLGQLATLGERAGRVFTLENLNTAVDHPGTPFARAADTLTLVEAVASPHLLMNLDLYHAQIGEGNPIELAGGAPPFGGQTEGRRRPRPPRARDRGDQLPGGRGRSGAAPRHPRGSALGRGPGGARPRPGGGSWPPSPPPPPLGAGDHLLRLLDDALGHGGLHEDRPHRPTPPRGTPSCAALRSQREAWAGCMVWSTTVSSSPRSACRSTWSRRRAAKPWTVRAASLRRGVEGASTRAWDRRRRGGGRGAGG